MIVDAIRDKGLQIVSVADLLHKDRSEIMSPIPTSELWSAWLNLLAFWTYSAGLKFIVLVFFVGDLLMAGRLLSIGALAIYDRIHAKRFGERAETTFNPGVAILIPAY